MSFNFNNLARFTYKAIFKSRETNYRLTPKRIGLLALAFAIYVPVELVTWAGLLLDELLFRGYREESVRQPVFIVGNPRSGTTFLHRLLAKDENTFLAMKTWEMFLAPSITMRKVLIALADLGKRMGAPIQRRLARWERRWQRNNAIHKVALHAPEEDEYLLTHIFSSLKIWLYVAMLDEAAPYTYFDSAMPEPEKERIMRFYVSCLQRHLYAHETRRGQRHYLAKNPNFTPMIDTLYEYFPNAKIIYLARNPLDMIPSYISLKEEEWQLLGDPLEPYASRDYILDAARHWYRYPLERLAQEPEERYIVVNFNDLVGDARDTVTTIYERFGFELTSAYDDLLREATERARNHESDHEYSLEEMGLTRGQIVTEYVDVFERFGFDTRDDARI